MEHRIFYIGHRLSCQRGSRVIAVAKHSFSGTCIRGWRSYCTLSRLTSHRQTNIFNTHRLSVVRPCNFFTCVKPNQYSLDIWSRRSKVQGPLPSCYNQSLLSAERQFHTSGKKDAFPPLIWAAVSLISKTGAVLTGRRYRQWLKTQPEEIRRKHHRRVLQFWAGLAAFLAGIASVYYYSHIQEAPLTGRKRFITLTRDQYMKVADFESENLIEQYKEKMLPATHPMSEDVLKVAQRIVKNNQDFPEIKEHNWTIHVVDDAEKNAFVLPNGHIFVCTGMIKFVENEDQFAFILGHEMSHALLLHGAEQLSYSQFVDYFVIAIMAAIWTLMPNDGIAIVSNWFYNQVMDLTVHKPYSRKLEKEADKVGLYLIAKACYDVREGSVLWYRMSVADDITGEGRIPEWLSTHPAHENRVKLLDHLLPKALEEREKCNCDMLPPLDPRKRAIQLRKIADNAMVAVASKANIDKTHKDKQVISTFNPFKIENIPFTKPKSA